MKPFFFGDPQRPLFGVYTPPADRIPPKGAVLLCYPFGPEYLRSHRAMREMAVQLADSGHHSLRFDYYGCGDSSGATEDGNVDQWLDDVAQAIEELRETSGRPRVALLGLRFGATLAALAASSNPHVEKLVLWDPIVSGSGYLDELDRRNRAYMEGRPRPPEWKQKQPPDEVLGTPLPDSLRKSVEAIDLLALREVKARITLVLSTEQTPWLPRLREHLASIGAQADHEHIALPALWLKQDRVDRTLVPHQVIHRLSKWLSERAA